MLPIYFVGLKIEKGESTHFDLELKHREVRQKMLQILLTVCSISLRYSLEELKCVGIINNA